jgi:hypothetical protein
VHDTHVGDYHVIMTNLPPAEVNRITLEIYARWLQFALGQRALGGRMLVAPTGQYARSIQVQYEDGIAVGVIADPSIAPEAAILETGHQAVDLKTKLQHGRAYPMHRNIGRLSMGQRAQMWSEFRTRTGKVRTRTNTGYASIGPNSAPDSWIIPAMPAYSPSLALSEMAAAMAKRS